MAPGQLSGAFRRGRERRADMSKRVSAPVLLALGSLVAGACGDGPGEPSRPPPLADQIVYTESNGPSLINHSRP